MFGLVDSIKEDMEDWRNANRTGLMTMPSYMGLTPGLKNKLADLIRNKHLGSGPIDMGVPTDYFEPLQRQALTSHKLAWVNDFGEFRLTTEGLQAGETFLRDRQLPVPASSGSVLQRVVRNARADWQAVSEYQPFFLDKWWWRHTLWNIRQWWAGTNPEQPRPATTFLPAPEPWSEEDRVRNARMWIDSKFTAFWLCPSGVQKGLEHLDTVDALKENHGALCLDAAQAVGEIAQLCELLPEPKPLTVIEHIQSKMFDKTGDFNVEEVQDKTGILHKIQWVSEPGHGKSHAAPPHGALPFIVMHDNVVEATEEAKKLADIQGGRAEDVVALKNKAKKPKKPKQFALMDQFDKAWDKMVEGSKVPDRVGIPIENPCYLHAYECDCPKVLPNRQIYVPMPKVKPPKKSKK